MVNLFFSLRILTLPSPVFNLFEFWNVQLSPEFSGKDVSLDTSLVNGCYNYMLEGELREVCDCFLSLVKSVASGSLK